VRKVASSPLFDGLDLLDPADFILNAEGASQFLLGYRSASDEARKAAFRFGVRVR